MSNEESGITITIDIRDKMPSGDKFMRAMETARYAIGERLRAELPSIIPVRTGRLLASLDISYTEDSIMLRMDPVDPRGYHYGMRVIKGALPHEIEPLGPWPLHFFWERLGIEVWLYHVNHPGYQPRDFTSQLEDMVIRITQAEVGRAIYQSFMQAQELE